MEDDTSARSPGNRARAIREARANGPRSEPAAGADTSDEPARRLDELCNPFEGGGRTGLRPVPAAEFLRDLGLDPAAEPRRVPPVFAGCADGLGGAHPAAPGVPVHVEAALHRGAPVYFHVGPVGAAPRGRPAPRVHARQPAGEGAGVAQPAARRDRATGRRVLRIAQLAPAPDAPRRYGLLAFVAFEVTFEVLMYVPVTTDLSAWYSGASATGLVLLGALAGYGFWAACRHRTGAEPVRA